MMWLALVLNDLPLQVFSRASADPAPLAVTCARPRVRILVANASARAGGIAAGQGLASAIATLPQLRLRAREPALERAMLEEVAVWAGQFSAQVALDPPDTVLLDISATLRLFGGAPRLVAAARQGLNELGLQASCAWAPSPLAARWLARCGLSSPADGETLAATLDTLPVDVLNDGCELDPGALELLAGLGLTTLGEVRALPRSGLARRQAGRLLDVLARAYGERPDPRPPFVAPPSFEHRLVLPVPSEAIEPLLFASRRLFTALAGWLGARQAAIDHCELVLEHEDGACSRLDILVGAPCRDEARLAALARERLATLELPAPVEALRLNAPSVLLLAPRSAELFADGAGSAEQAVLLLERLQARLGADAVSCLQAQAEHRPEAAWRIRPPGRTNRNDACPAAGNAIRPLWLLSAPRALPESQALTLLAGPERIESGWWDDAEIRRDYYLARPPDQGLWWVFHELHAAGRWYLHGYFA